MSESNFNSNPQDVLIGQGRLEGLEKMLKKTTLIGREEDNNIVISHPCVSRKHCRIEYDEQNQPVIIDNNSKNGTYRNGEKISPQEKAVLNSGDGIGVGGIEDVLRYYNVNDLVEKNLKIMSGYGREEMIGYLHKESFGGNAGYDGNRPCAGANFYFDRQTGEIKIFSNNPNEIENAPRGLFRIAHDFQKGGYEIIKLWYSRGADGTEINREATVQELEAKGDKITKHLSGPSLETSRIPITNLAKEILLKSVEAFNEKFKEGSNQK